MHRWRILFNSRISYQFEKPVFEKFEPVGKGVEGSVLSVKFFEGFNTVLGAPGVQIAYKVEGPCSVGNG